MDGDFKHLVVHAGILEAQDRVSTSLLLSILKVEILEIIYILYLINVDSKQHHTKVKLRIPCVAGSVVCER